MHSFRAPRAKQPESLGKQCHRSPDRLRQRCLVAFIALLLASCTTQEPPAVDPTSTRYNVLLVVFEDLSPRIGAYGDPVAHTPVLDALTQESVRYTRVFTTAGVCAPSRSALITGVHQQTLGTQHMRTRSPVPGLRGGGPIEYDAVPPPTVRAFPELLRAAGYYTSNNGKTDYQFGTPFLIWDDAAAPHPWRGRPTGQPFFAMVNIMTTHESHLWPTEGQSDNRLVEFIRERNQRELKDKQERTDPARVTVPPYLPDTPAVRADIARQYDNLSFAEGQLATLLQDLKADGLEAETLVIVTTDHGDGLPRMKRSLYDSGLHVPMLVRFPDRRGAGQVDDQLVSFVDLAPTILSYAEQPVPSFVQGQVVFGTDSAARRSYVYAAMDRHDEVPDRLRAARDERYKYIRNFKPQAPFFRPLSFRDQMPTMQAIWRAHAAGTAPPALAALLSPNRPAEELYDLQTDPHEVINLAKDPQHHETLIRLRAAYDAFAARAGDASEQPEAKMIARMWPGMEQPVTAAPVVDVRAGRVHLTSPTPGAAIGYRFSGQQNWRVYTQPLVLAEESPGQESTVLEAQAERYGYERSAVVSVPF